MRSKAEDRQPDDTQDKQRINSLTSQVSLETSKRNTENLTNKWYAKHSYARRNIQATYTPLKTDPVSLTISQRRISRVPCYFSPVQRLRPWWLMGHRWGQTAGRRRGSTDLSKLKIHLLFGPNCTSREMFTHASVVQYGF